MTSFPRSPRILKGGLVLIDPDTSAVQRTVVLQYNPDSISRTLQVQTVGGESKDRSQVLRLTGLRLAQSGTLEIATMESPLTLFLWSKT